MEDFEVSLDISDRDWECFFAECEECNLLPPSLAGLDDSGMSDIDDAGSGLVKSAQKCEPTAGFSEAGLSADANPDCVASPVDCHLNKYGVGGMESVLSGSEEDIHLQSVNMFFERMKSLSGVVTQPSPAKAGKNREVKQEEKLCGDGPPTNSGSLPESIPKVNNLPAKGKTAGGGEAAIPVDAVAHANTMNAGSGSNIFHQPQEAGAADLLNDILSYTEAELFIREETCAETGVNTATPQGQCNGRTAFSEMCTSLRDAVREDLSSSQSSLSKDSHSDSLGSQETLKDVQRNEDQKSRSETKSPNKETTREVSSVKRRRKKRRQHGGEPVDGGCAREGRARVKPDDSEEERHAGEGVKLTDPQKRVISPSSDLPVTITEENAEVKFSNAVPPRGVSHRDLAGRTVGPEPGSAASMVNGDAQKAAGTNDYSEGSDPTAEAPDAERQTPDAEAFQKLHRSIVSSEKEQIENGCPAEVDWKPGGVSQSTNQDGKVSVAKSALAFQAGREEGSPCPRDPEPQRQLETGCHIVNHDNAIKNNRDPPRSEEIPAQTTNFSGSSPGESDLFINSLERETERSLETSKLDVLAEIAQEKSQDPLLSGENNTEGQNKEKYSDLSTDGDSLLNSSDFTPASSCCTLYTGSFRSLSNENSSCSSFGRKYSTGNEETATPESAKHEEGDAGSGPQSPTRSPDATRSEPETAIGDGEVMGVSRGVEREPGTKTDSQHPVFAMSSFWSEMERLTINDILGLRMASKGDAAFSLTPLKEEAEVVSEKDSGSISLKDDPKPVATREDALKELRSEESNPDTVLSLDYTPSPGVTWRRGPVIMSGGVDVYPQTMFPSSVGDVRLPAQTGNPQQCFGKISKNISVHNLQALESECFGFSRPNQAVQTLDEGDPECLRDMASKRDASSTNSYRISFTDIFRFLFGGKQSTPSASAVDNVPVGAGGNSVPETYDHFFSEFDTDSFFYTAEDQNELVPIFSCSRSRNMQFPEVYECFFASSSSDDSSEEEDDERSGPLKVETRFSRKANTSPVTTDIYDNFFTDGDVVQDFFWKATFSFRNVKRSQSTADKGTSNPLSLVPRSRRTRYLERAIYPPSTLGSPDVMFPDLHHLEGRVYRQLMQQSVTSEDFQSTIPNPKLDSSFLPLNQSDMCLVCIAFASWVLKTANPQVGDAWKAVLLANVSALSAIRYLRKYVKVEETSVPKDLYLTAPPDSCV